MTWSNRPHILAHNKRVELPKWVIFFDTETKEHIINEKQKDLTLKFGYARLTRRRVDGTLYTVSDKEFTRVAEFYEWLDDVATGRERYFIVAHNIGFDARVIGVFDQAAQYGWRRGKFILDGLNFILEYTKGTTKLTFINNQQLFNYSLKMLGKSVGVEKMDVDFGSDDFEHLKEYCKNDVEIMVTAWNKLFAYIRINDLGNFALTTASQSLNAFRHKYMKEPIYIHHFKEPVKLERESYHGGRTECWYIGKWDSEPIYYVDVNSMYPFVMRDNNFPTRYLETTKGNFSYQRHANNPNIACIARVKLDIKDPYIPLVRDGRLIFPTGTFTTVLAYPEFMEAYKRGAVKEIIECAWYLTAPIFKDYVNDLYALRMKYKKEGDTAFELITKNLLNSLYGKFGQRNTTWRKVGDTKTDYLGVVYDNNLDTGLSRKLRIIDHVIEEEEGTVEGANAFPAIASFVTSYARLVLWRYIEAANIENVLYMDTDSLFITRRGYERLRGDIDDHALGKLKLVGTEDSMIIRAPKDYIFGESEKIKGIRHDARRTGEGSFEQDRFEGMLGAIRRGAKTGVRIDKITKRLHREYKKGIILKSGRVVPFDLRE